MRMLSIVLGLLSGLLFGIATPVSKYALSYLDGFQLAGLLYLGSALAFLPHCIKNASRDFRKLFARGNRRPIAGIILSGGILGPLFLMLGLSSADSMSVSVWLNMELVATALAGFLLFREHIGRFQLAGIVLSVAAGILVSYREGMSGLSSGLCVLAACVFWGIDNQLTSLVDGIPPQTTTFIKGLAGGAVNLAIGTLLSPHAMEPRSIALALAVGIVSYGVSIFLYVTSAQNLGATRSQVLFSTAPFWGILAAAVFLGERTDPAILTASVLLASGIVCSSMQAHSHAHVHHAVTHIHLHRHDDAHHTHIHGDDPSPGLLHTHEHTHEEITHAHPHDPDIHHHHAHGKQPGGSGGISGIDAP